IFSTFEKLGIYSITVSLASGASIIGSVFSTVWAPMVYKWASNEEDLAQVDAVTETLLAVVALFFCLAGLGSSMVLVLFPPEYARVQYLLMPCLFYPLLYVLSEATVIGVGLSKKTGFAMAAA